MSKPLVYLAGPISGQSYRGATDWRNETSDELARDGIVGLSPMRGKLYLLDEQRIGDVYEETTLSTEKAILARDRFDCQRADLVLFNFLGAEKASLGSCIELGWADAYRKPCVLVLDKTVENPHNHGMIRGICGWHASSLLGAIAIVKAVLLP